MSFYIRKSVRVGPFRFNLSKSGIGVSAGVRGFRAGTGPHGSYVHMGTGGIYFRKSLSAGRHSPSPGRPAEPASLPAIHPRQPEVPEDAVGPFIEIESASVLEMTDSSSEALLKEFITKRKRIRLWPMSAGLTVLTIAILAANSSPFWILALAALPLAAVTVWLYFWDEIRKSVVVFYDLEAPLECAYQKLVDAIRGIQSCARVWHLESTAQVHDRKYYAGADQLVRRKAISIRTGPFAYFKTNVDIPCIPVGRQILAFTPDRLLVFENNAVGAVAYESLDIRIERSNFMESGGLPSDAQVVGRTWQYVNKKGGPDRRFNNNPEIPIALYEEGHFGSTTGLNETIQSSRTEVIAPLKLAVDELAGWISRSGVRGTAG